eukprot:TRINITY_DN587_c0_g1_i1.p1 TRINITY_DN587_c0_g1~~TRINITY_DN587_c0_g1_i1.p1  ORF type:complete len:180 (-),score=28.56 TRINITY_DN587_c0_g1_i1:123-662(-)
MSVETLLAVLVESQDNANWEQLLRSRCSSDDPTPKEKRPHSCPFPGCKKSFLRPAHLLIHKRIHTGEKPFVCEYEGCGKRWNQKSALKQHLRSHTGEKPFSCAIRGCLKRFSTSSSCKRHISSTHKNHTICSPAIEISVTESNSSCPSSPFSGSSDDESKETGMLVIEVRKMNVDFLLN